MFHKPNHHTNNNTHDDAAAFYTAHFFCLSMFIILFSCAELGQERRWDNPLDPNGSNFFPPEIILPSDSIIFTYPGSELNVSVSGKDSNDTILEYVWTLYNDSTIRDTGILSTIPVKYKASDTGLNLISVYASDKAGLKSKMGTILIHVRPFMTTITKIENMTVKQDSTLKIKLTGSVNAGKLQFLQDSDFSGSYSTILSDSTLTLFKPEGGSLFVHWAIRDESNFTQYDTFSVYFNKTPTPPKLISPLTDTIEKLLDYDYEKAAGSVILRFNARDPDDSSSTLTYQLQYYRLNVDTVEIVSLRDTILQLEGISASSIYYWKFTVCDPVGNISSSNGKFITPGSPVPPAGMKLIKSKGQQFYMGQKGYDSTATPLHAITFTRNFWIDSAEVTCDKFTSVLKPSGFTVCTGQSPVVNINWFDAVMYCNALSKQFNLDTCYTYTSITGIAGNHCQLVNVSTNHKAKGYRLPTEAEWEYACRGGKSTLFFWGNDPLIISQYAWTSESGVSSVQKITQLKPNPFGLYDIAGNVWEWCNDWYNAEYYKRSDPKDPVGPLTGTEQVIRGGAAINHYYFSQSGTRSKLHPAQYNQYTGFRTVLVIQE